MTWLRYFTRVLYLRLTFMISIGNRIGLVFGTPSLVSMLVLVCLSVLPPQFGSG